MIFDHANEPKHNPKKIIAPRIPRYGDLQSDLDSLRNQSLSPCSKYISIGSWNVEGLSDAKIAAMQYHISNSGCQILCIQETHHNMSDYWISEEGFF